MPPQQKYTKESILKTAFQLVREQGVENLNARNIAKILNSSIRPIFSYYKNMAELKGDLFAMVGKYHSSYFNKVESDENIFLNIGMTYVDFALEEPNLFKMLFMANGYSGKTLNEFFDSEYEDCPKQLNDAIAMKYDTDSTESIRVFIDIWLYAHGIASMLVTNQLPTPRSEIESMLKNMYDLLLTKAKKKENNQNESEH